ncbi:EEF1A lysine methyltransferase 1 [Atheta coriaria]|uniref:EEF1A lysine methyltransferase 1 n=1 Tax=Dalotia coriaria TaxID=877792 RepID=UPI0031F39ED1
MINNDSDDDVPQLSAETFLALQEFYNEEEQRSAIQLEVSQIAKSDADIDMSEDWQLSQFWYDSATIQTLVKIALESVGPSGNIALLSCPSLYKKMKLNSTENHIIHLYEFDKRFAIHGEDFTFYDYKAPLSIPSNRKEYYDLVIADPPFLSDECLIKTAATIKLLAKNKIILCTGAVMGEMAHRLLSLEKTNFNPGHKNNLANDFHCYANFNISTWL